VLLAGIRIRASARSFALLGSLGARRGVCAAPRRGRRASSALEALCRVPVQMAAGREASREVGRRCVVRLSPPCTRERDNTCGPASRMQYTRSRRSDETFMTTHARNHGPLGCRDHRKRVAAELASFVATSTRHARHTRNTRTSRRRQNRRLRGARLRRPRLACSRRHTSPQAYTHQ